MSDLFYKGTDHIYEVFVPPCPSYLPKSSPPNINYLKNDVSTRELRGREQASNQVTSKPFKNKARYKSLISNMKRRLALGIMNQLQNRMKEYYNFVLINSTT